MCSEDEKYIPIIKKRNIDDGNEVNRAGEIKYTNHPLHPEERKKV